LPDRLSHGLALLRDFVLLPKIALIGSNQLGSDKWRYVKFYGVGRAVGDHPDSKSG
jgi:hypothetical protein